MPRKTRKRFLKDGSPAEWVIQASILAWLETTELMFHRQNSGKVFVKGRKIILGPDGAADIAVLVPPRASMLGLEVKSKNGKQNKDQKKYQKDLEAAGGLYFIVRSLKNAKDSVAEAIGHYLGRGPSRDTP